MPHQENNIWFVPITYQSYRQTTENNICCDCVHTWDRWNLFHLFWHLDWTYLGLLWSDQPPPCWLYVRLPNRKRTHLDSLIDLDGPDLYFQRSASRGHKQGQPAIGNTKFSRNSIGMGCHLGPIHSQPILVLLLQSIPEKTKQDLLHLSYRTRNCPHFEQTSPL